MKKLAILFLVIGTLPAFGQSESFLTLKEKFHGAKDVVSVNVGGFLVRTALWISGEDDWKDELGDVRNVRLITIPQKAFENRNLKLSGFKKVLHKDNFEEAIQSRERNEVVTIYMQEHKDANLYFILIEEPNQVTAVEILGKIDPKKIVAKHSRDKYISYN